jgi:hypothetical protein
MELTLKSMRFFSVRNGYINLTPRYVLLLVANLPHGSHECKLIDKSIHSKPCEIRGLPLYLCQCIIIIQNYTFKTLFNRDLHKVVGAGGSDERKKTN